MRRHNLLTHGEFNNFNIRLCNFGNVTKVLLEMAFNAKTNIRFSFSNTMNDLF